MTLRRDLGKDEPKAAAPPQVVRVIGGGLAGPEAALTAARHGCEVSTSRVTACGPWAATFFPHVGQCCSPTLAKRTRR